MDLMFDVKGFVIPLTSTIFVILLASTTQYVTADHVEEFGQGIFKDQDSVNFAKTTDSNSKYQIHLQAEVRNAQGQLIGIAETSRGNYIPHEISDLLFYEKLDVKPEIVTIDNIKYEKVQYVDSPSRDYDEVDYFLISALMLCGEIHGHDPKCMSVFQASTAAVLVTQTDVVTNHWTILRVMN
tara:strand:+ start:128 stop:676 length:549 start_codon:yes stop_codon:yes gene_type:complete